MRYVNRQFVTATRRHTSAGVLYVLKRSRLSAIYAIGAAVLAVAWLLSLVLSPQAADTSHANSLNTPETTTLETTTPEGGPGPMTLQSPDADNQSTSPISVNADDNGTTVTVNGTTQTLPPDQSFQQSYDTANDHSTTHVDISVDNNGGSPNSNRSVNLHMHSSTRSNSTDSSTNP